MSWIVPTVLLIFLVGGLVFWGVYVFTGNLQFGRPFGFFFFPFGFIFFILLLFFVFRLAFWGGRWGGRRDYYGADAKEILRRRYARGEINKDQFDQMMRDLDEHK